LTRTYDLLTVLVQKNIITEKQGEEIMNEMIENGFWIKK
jgi:predicted nucleic acid-binding protein